MPDIYADDTVTIEELHNLGSYGNNAYILRPANGGPVTIIDAPEGSEATIEALGRTPVERIVVTHHHFDHWAGFDTLRAHTQATVYAGDQETNLEQTRDIQPLAHDSTFTVGTAQVRVIHTPGHTPGSICLHIGEALLTGDTLFPGGPGRTGSNQDLVQEIESITTRLYPLPDNTLVLPGHGDTTTIEQSKAEHAIYAAKDHPADLHGDVLWLES
jgi:hydroxyacylglutathione hydrolase